MLVVVVRLVGQSVVADVVVTGRLPCRHGRPVVSREGEKNGGRGFWAGPSVLGRAAKREKGERERGQARGWVASTRESVLGRARDEKG
jgi:hypothetical protein